MQQQQPRRPRPFYVPPYRRYDAGPDNEFTHSRPPLGQSRGGHSRGRGRDGVGGGYRGRGGFAGRRDVPYGQNPTPERTLDPFDELEVVEESNGAINFGAYEDIPVEATGTDISAPVSTFAEIDLGEAINQNIKRCNYTRPTPIQRHAIPVAVGGRDLMACAQTGSGKTAAYCLPIIHGVLKSKAHVKRTATRVACPLALVLSPTRELSCQIHDEAKKFAHQTGVKVGVAYGGAPFGSQVRILERGVDVLVATPGRLADMVERQKVSLKMIKYLAIDEADRMLDMGFEPQIRRIVDQMDMPPSNARQTMLFSATFPDDIQMLAADFLTNYVFLAVGRIGSSTDLITQKVEYVEDIDKKGYLMDLLCNLQQNGSSGKRDLTLIFVETKRGADILESWLSDNGFPAIAIHGDKVQFERERALKSFKTGATPIMVATDVASRGLDIPHVAHVVNFDLPKSIDDYVHRIGRTGRAGKSGTATAFFNNKNMSLAKALADLIKEGKQEVPSWLIECAEQSFDGSFSKQHSRGGSKFGGRDFRRGGGGGGGGGGPRNKSYSSDGFEYSNPSTAAADDLINGVAAVDYSESYNNHGSLDRKDALLGYAAVEPCGWE